MHAGDEELLARLLAASRRPENARCADCDARGPKWATVTHGGFLCTQCAGVHRSLGVHVSFVLSTTLDKWTAAQVEAVEAAGNAALNAELERSLGPLVKPTADAPRSDRERFIRAKYEARQFASPSPATPPAASRSSRPLQRQEAVRLPPTAAADAIPAPSTASSAHEEVSADQRGMVEFVGVLEVRLVAAADLAPMNVRGKSDPYAALQLGAQRVRSRHVANSVHPRWGETLRLSWNGAAPLRVELFDHSALRADRFMGGFEVPSARLRPLLEAPGAQVDSWFQARMPREWASSFGEHLVAGAEGLGRGVYRGVTGVWKDPIQGARERGLEGFATGVGRGVAGVVYRPIKGLGAMVRHTGRSVGVGRAAGAGDDALVPAGRVHLVLTLQQFT